MQNFLNTALGSYLKVFLSVVLTLVLTQLASGLNVFQLDWGIIANGALVSFLPVVINALNPKYKNYGRKKQS
jgi:hypothetical protein